MDADMMGPFRFVGWHAQFEWKSQDLWIGAFWKRVGNAYRCVFRGGGHGSRFDANPR